MNRLCLVLAMLVVTTALHAEVMPGIWDGVFKYLHGGGPSDEGHKGYKPKDIPETKSDIIDKINSVEKPPVKNEPPKENQ